jgi:hypothetical protein
LRAGTAARKCEERNGYRAEEPRHSSIVSGVRGRQKRVKSWIYIFDQEGDRIGRQAQLAV